MLKLAYQYMRYYKSQTFAIFASIVLTAALLSGIGSLMYSSRINDETALKKAALSFLYLSQLLNRHECFLRLRFL